MVQGHGSSPEKKIHKTHPHLNQAGHGGVYVSPLHRESLTGGLWFRPAQEKSETLSQK
jgi:hypothetical protein